MKSILPILAVAVMAGCTQPTLIQNPDPELRHSVSELKTDSSARFPYRFDAPHMKDSTARSQVDYGFDRLDILNFSGEDWENVEVWVNRQYVCHVPELKDRKLSRIDFAMLYNIYGKNFPLDNTKEIVHTVEVYKDGQFHDLFVASYDW